MNRYLIADFDGALLCGLRDEKRPLTFDLYRREEALSSYPDANSEIRRGDIFIAKVKRILRAQRCAFCDVSPGRSCFLPLDRGSVLYADGHRSGKDGSDLREGAEVLVQIAKDAHTGKKPVLSSFFVFPEYDDPRAQIRQILETAKTRTCYTRLYRAPSALVRDLLSLDQEALEMIRTDDAEVFRALQEDPFLQATGLDRKLSLYTDDYPLTKLYALRSGLEEALVKRVRLKSGTELVIEHTEAFWTVDVNSAKSAAAADRSRKIVAKEDAVLRTNLEAASELALQLRLRNMSGIIVVDFINMREEESREAVTLALREACEADPAGVHLGGFTAFGLFELSRKRTRPALYEQVANARKNTRENMREICVKSRKILEFP